MSLIINKSIPMFKQGYPTVSDKYNVAGGILSDNTPVQFGALVKLGDTPGYFEASSGLTAASQLGGFVVATNVKLAEDFPGKTVQVNPGEAFNLLVSGFIAVKLAATVKIATIAPNVPANFTAAGEVTTADDTNKVAAIPNTVFTGLSEKQPDGSYLAEICVK